MCESIITKKLGVGVTFPRVVLYFRRNTVGYGFIKLEIVIAILAMKLYVRNIRANMRNN